MLAITWHEIQQLSINLPDLPIVTIIHPWFIDSSDFILSKISEKWTNPVYFALLAAEILLFLSLEEQENVTVYQCVYSNCY